MHLNLLYYCSFSVKLARNITKIYRVNFSSQLKNEFVLLCSLTEWRPCPLSSFCRDFFSENRVRWSRRNRQELQDAAKVLRRIRRQIHRRRLTLESPMHSNLYSIWNYRIICSNNTRQCHRTKHRMSQIFKKRF